MLDLTVKDLRVEISFSWHLRLNRRRGFILFHIITWIILRKIFFFVLNGSTGANEPSCATILIYESTGDRDLAIRPGSLRLGIGDDVRRCKIQSVRVESSLFLSRRSRSHRKSIFSLEQFLVHHWYTYATRERFKSKGTRNLFFYSCSYIIYIYSVKYNYLNWFERPPAHE